MRNKSIISATISALYALPFLMFFSLTPGSSSGQEGKGNQTVQADKVLALKLVLRDLYASHIFWVRNVVYATMLGQDAWAKASEDEAVKNARALGDTIQPFYGQEAAAKLFQLFAGHYGAVKAYLLAAKKGSKSEKDKAIAELTKNAEEIAAFLSGANPYLPKDTVFSLLKVHGSHHLSQIDEVKAKNFAHEAEIWNAMLKHIYVISDAIAEALAKQFPEKI